MSIWIILCIFATKFIGMIKRQDLSQTIHNQRKSVLSNMNTFPREMLGSIDLQHSQYADIITGIRRCGKSTLVEQLMQQYAEESLYVNFDTPALFGFTLHDFRTLDEEINLSGAHYLFFDEIQVVDGWETYVRSRIDAHNKVVVTGSNASMLSRELGTRMTGRHVNHRLMPFSYSEFLGYKQLMPGVDSLVQYMQLGGFPAYLQTGRDELLSELAVDVLYRDILVRYGLRDELSLKSLMTFLMGNVGNLVTGSKLTQSIKVKSPKTVLDYIAYMENAYLLFSIPKFSYSYRSQLVNPKKIYSVDLGLQTIVSPSFSTDTGRRLENLVFIELYRRGCEVYYYSENGHECDFVVCKNRKPEQLIQVCEEITTDNQDREYDGLIDAMRSLNIEKGMILTMNQSDSSCSDGLLIETVPTWEWITAGPTKAVPIQN